MPAVSLLVPLSALAQSNACDQLKATLAARIEATGVRGYSLEVVTAATPVPAGAKAIGNCEGGEQKVLYRRWGGGSAAPSASSASAVAPEAAPKRLPPAVRPPVPAPVAPVTSVAAPAPAPAPVVASSSTPTSAPTAAQEVPAQPVAGAAPLSQRASAFVNEYWRWLLALLLVPLAAAGWAWRAHDLAYDRNGLPRGPRL
ncbi:MAG: DUF1161 domain-containing protein [Burkholderiales bacterium]